MAQTNVPAQTALANVFLHSFDTATQRNHVIRNLAAAVDNDTVGLVAALTAQVPDHEAERSLQTFLLRAIERGEPSVAASLCVQYSHLTDVLLRRAEDHLSGSLALLCNSPKNSGMIVPPSSLLTSTTNLLDGLSLDEYASRSSEDTVSLTLAYLGFVRQTFRVTSPERSLTLSFTIFEHLFCLLAAHNMDIASYARDACFSFIAAYRTKAVQVSSSRAATEMDQHIWRCIDSLLDQSPHSSYRTTSYAIWLRWLDTSNVSHFFEQVMQSNKYWAHLLNALACGDVEQRKISLHILRISVAALSTAISTKDMVYEPVKSRSM